MKTNHRTGRHSFAGMVCAGVALLMATTISIQAQYAYFTLNVPGSSYSETYAYGFSGNNIVGSYENSSGFAQGFLYNGSSYTTLSVPGAAATWAFGIDGNNIVGYYGNINAGQGYLYNGSSYTTLSVPGATWTEAFGVSGNNIVGWYYNGSTWQGFLYNGSSYTTLAVPGATWTEPFGISGNNIVGYYANSSGYDQAFLYNGSSYTTLNVPGVSYTAGYAGVPGAASPCAYGISGNNVVGSYENSSGQYQGYLYNGSSYTTLSVPSAAATWAWGIEGNSIVGYYGDGSGNTYGFLAVPVPEPSALELLVVGAAVSLVRRPSQAHRVYALAAALMTFGQGWRRSKDTSAPRRASNG